MKKKQHWCNHIKIRTPPPFPRYGFWVFLEIVSAFISFVRILMQLSMNYIIIFHYIVLKYKWPCHPIRFVRLIKMSGVTHVIGSGRILWETILRTSNLIIRSAGVVRWFYKLQSYCKYLRKKNMKSYFEFTSLFTYKGRWVNCWGYV